MPIRRCPAGGARRGAPAEPGFGLGMNGNHAPKGKSDRRKAGGFRAAPRLPRPSPLAAPSQPPLASGRWGAVARLSSGGQGRQDRPGGDDDGGEAAHPLVLPLLESLKQSIQGGLLAGY